MYSKHSCVTQTFDGMRAATQKKKQNKKKTTARQVDLNCDIFLAAGMSSPLPGCCDFAAGLCGYTQDKQNDAADWEWRRGPTPTSYTGPRGDHTSGLGEMCIYCEVSLCHETLVINLDFFSINGQTRVGQYIRRAGCNIQRPITLAAAYAIYWLGRE